MKSSIQENSIELKEIILKKHTHSQMTSEELFKIENQPQDTCPFINDAIDQNEKVIKKINDFAYDFSQVRTLNPQDNNCSCGEVLKDNLRNLAHLEGKAYDILNVLEKMNDNLEYLRTHCQELRSYGQNLKDMLWESYHQGQIYSSEEILKHISSRPYCNLTAKDLTQNLSKISLPMPKFEPVGCKEKCENFYHNRGLESLFDSSICDLNLSDDSITSSFENYDKISDWTDGITRTIRSLDKDCKFDLSSEVRKDYEIAYNDYHKQRYFRSFKYMTPFKLDLSSEIKQFIQNKEDVSGAKKVATFEEEANFLIGTYLSFRSEEDYEYAIKQNKMFHDSLEEFLLRLQTFITSLRHDSPATAIRSRIIDLKNHIETNGAQVFTLEE